MRALPRGRVARFSAPVARSAARARAAFARRPSGLSRRLAAVPQELWPPPLVRRVSAACAPDRAGRCVPERPSRRDAMLKILGWIVLIIFIIGLLVVFGVIDLIF